MNPETIYFVEHLSPGPTPLPVRYKEISVNEYYGFENENSAFDILIDEAISSLRKSSSDQPILIHISDIVSAIQKEQRRNCKLNWFPLDMMIQGAEMIQSVQHILSYSQVKY